MGEREREENERQRSVELAADNGLSVRETGTKTRSPGIKSSRD